MHAGQLDEPSTGANKPRAQEEHSLAPFALYRPKEQFKQFAAAAALNCPETHAGQLEEPSSGAYSPAAQIEQKVALLPLNKPVAHLVQRTALAAEYLPERQDAHEVAPVLVPLKEPGSHVLQSAFLDSLCEVPKGHSVHAVDFRAGW
jgi:hypothetical protein